MLISEERELGCREREERENRNDVQQEMKYQCIAYPTEKRHYINPSLFVEALRFFLANLRSFRSNFVRESTILSRA